MRRVLSAVAAALFALSMGSAAKAAVSLYTNEGLFQAAAGALTFESFETASLNTATSVGFPGGTFSCSGSTWCPGFFGISTLTALDGTQSVFFATPDSATFTFNSPISAFGIWIDGFGDVGTTTMTVTTSGGALFNPFSSFNGSPIGNFANGLFVGIVDTTGTFSSVTFSATQPNDGVFFDRLQYSAGTAVPEPLAWQLMIAAFGTLGLAMRRRRMRLL